MKEDIPTRSICRFLEILQVINRLGPVSLLAIAQEIDIPYPTVSRVIQTLLESELIERVENTKCYRAAGKSLSLSSGFAAHDRLAAVARGRMETLTAKIGWPLALATRVGPSMVVRESTHHLTSLAFSGCPIGFEVPLLESAAGHVWLAFTSGEERECILEGLELIHGRSPMLALFRSGAPIARIRADAYATYERGQRSLDPGKISSISVPVLHQERLVGVLSLMLFASAMPMANALQRYLHDLRAAVDDIARHLLSSVEQEAAPQRTRRAVPAETVAKPPVPANPAHAADRRLFDDAAAMDPVVAASIPATRAAGARRLPSQSAR